MLSSFNFCLFVGVKPASELVRVMTEAVSSAEEAPSSSSSSLRDMLSQPFESEAVKSDTSPVDLLGWGISLGRPKKVEMNWYSVVALSAKTTSRHRNKASGHACCWTQ